MRKLKQDKKGLSILIGYVLLIIIGLSLSILVYNWLKRQTPQKPIECPDTVSLMISNYACYTDSGIKFLNMTLQNNGLYSLSGITIKVSNDTKIPTKALTLVRSIPANQTEQMPSKVEYMFHPELEPSGGGPRSYVFIIFNYTALNKITKIELMPLYNSEDGRTKIICSSQKLQYELGNGCNA